MKVLKTLKIKEKKKNLPVTNVKKYESESSLTAHKKIHETKENCNKCNTKFWTKPQLKNHLRTIHKEEIVESPKDYNCNGCFLQFESRLELKHHTEQATHSPGENSEKCFTCDEDFSGYWQLMNHRKAEHPSTKQCRYFLLDECKFDKSTCWYSHELNSQSEVKDDLSKNTCNVCDNNFIRKNDLMKHKKLMHKQKIQKCRKFLQGNCQFGGKTCWFSHEAASKNDKIEELLVNDQDFREEKTNIPPDQIQDIYSIINKLSCQVAELMKKPIIESQ